MNVPPEVIRARSGRIRRFVVAMEAVLWLLLLLERFGAIALSAVHGARVEIQRDFLVQCIAVAPEVLYLLALDATRRALAQFERGQFYTTTITRMLDRAGSFLAFGAFVSVFAVPILDRAIGANPGYWIAFDVAGLVLGALGASFSVISRVLGHGADLEAELDEIF